MKTQALLAVLALSSVTSHAELLSRLDGQAVYDTDSNVTWLTDANLAATQDFGVTGIHDNGRMHFDVADRWLDAMNAADYLGASNWRNADLGTGGHCFPIVTLQAACTSPDLGHMYYDILGALPPRFVEGEGIVVGSDERGDHEPFRNIQSAYMYDWQFSAAPQSFSFIDGYHDDGTGSGWVWAVRGGDISEPESIFLVVALAVSWLGLALSPRLRYRRTRNRRRLRRAHEDAD